MKINWMSSKTLMSGLLAAGLATFLAAPSWAIFPVTLRGTGDQEVIDMVTGPSGASYAVGTFDGNINFGDQVLGAQGLTDVFVAKINTFGDLVWLKSAGGTNVDRGLVIALDPAENVYIAGIFHDRATFGSAVDQKILDEFGDTNGDIFVAKLNGSDGGLLWAARASGAGNDTVEGLSFIPGDANAFPPIPERMAVAGSFQCDLRFYDETGPESPRASALGSAAGCGGNLNGRRLPLMAAIASNGSWQWRFVNLNTLRTGPNDPVGASIEGIASNSADEIYAFGHMRSQVTFGLSGGGMAVFHPGTPGSPTTLAPLSTSSIGGPGFQISSARARSGSFSAHSAHPNSVIFNYLRMPSVSATVGDVIALDWYHAFEFNQPVPPLCSAGGALLEVSLDGNLWSPVFTGYLENGPNGIDASSGLPSTFCGSSPSWPGFNQVRLEAPVTGTPGSTANIHFRWASVSAQATSGLWIDDIAVRRNGNAVASYSFPDPVTTDSNLQGHFVARVDNDGSGWDWVVRTPDEIDPRNIAVDRDDRLLLVGDKETGGTSTFPLEGGGNTVLDATDGVFVAEMRDTGSNGLWQWARSTVGGEGRGVFPDADGSTYLTGPFNGIFQREAGAPALASAGDDDIYIARLDSDGAWFPGGPQSLWGDGRSAVQAGGTNADATNAITGDGAGQLYVGGRYAGLSFFGTADNGALTSLDGNEAVIANLATSGRFAELSVGNLVVGEPVVPPAGAELTQTAFFPEFLLSGVAFDALETYFKWSPPAANGGTAQLIPIRALPTALEIRWRVAGQPLESAQRISTFGKLVWPSQRCNPGAGITSACYQLHLAGAPVEILPGAGGAVRSFLELHKADESDAVVANGTVFTASSSNFSTLVYVEGAIPDPANLPLDVRVVRTVLATEAPPNGGPPHLVRGAACTIGSEIVPAPADHDQPGRSGYVLNERAFYDGVGSQKPYDRQARLGQIVPVNRVSSSRPQDVGKEMRVAWYKLNDLGVAWPQKAVEYNCAWPAAPRQIIIASEQGTEVLGQPALDPLLFPQLHLYIQADPNLPGFNPNDEHALFAPSNTGTGVPAIFALRSDFGGTIAPGGASDPYVVAKYFDEGSQRWTHLVYRVQATGAGFGAFAYDGFAGRTVEPPYPVRLQNPCPQTRVVNEIEGADQPPIPFFRDTNSQLWARAAGTGAVRYHYPVQNGWFYDLDNNDVTDDLNGDGLPNNEIGACIPWMARLPVGQGGTLSPLTPIEVAYNIAWPADVPLLTVGETLVKPKRGLPDIFNQAAARVVFDELQQANPLDPSKTLTQLIDPLNPRSVALAELPTGTQALATSLDESGKTVITGNAAGDLRLPYALYSRLRWDPLTQKLIFSGLFDESGAGEPLLLLNLMTNDERDQLLALSSSVPWQDAVGALYALGRNPHGVQRICTATSVAGGVLQCDVSRPVDLSIDVLIGVVDVNDDGILEPYGAEGVNAALTAGSAQSTGYVTLAFNDSRNLALPISLEVLRVDCLQFPDPPAPPTLVSPYIGQVNVIAPVNVFDEQVTLRHNGDFGGRVESLDFEWYVHPDADGTPPTPLPDPDSGQLNGWQQIPVAPQGAVQITLGGANIQTLSDNWYLARYKGLPVCNNTADWTVFAGQPGSTPNDPRAQLSPGWVKRVVDGLNPFDARVSAFHTAATNTFASMIAQLGERYEGPIAFSDDPENLNQIGLIEAYETVFRRAMQLSIDSTPPVDYEPANAALLNIASRISDFYMLLGNEAYSDAQDPTIGISADGGTTGSLAPTIFNFQNQSASLLEEELVLLRGRDNRQAPVTALPVYNRYFWNFTQGDGEVAYALSYNISDQNNDGFINEFDARKLYPQGHGDAWGHYVTAIKIYYELLRHPFYSWNPRPEAVPVAGVPIQVDFLDERKFARAAAARARAGADIVDLTYRSQYVEDPAGQWQGYKDTNTERSWGLSGWGRRAGQGAYFDWLVVNAVLPDVDPDPTHVGIQKIDRTTVDEIDEIYAAYSVVQDQVDKADRGLNPLGLAKGVVPFDIDPAQVDAGKTHFEQIYNRAVKAVDNAVKVWSFANQLNRMLRFNQDAVDNLTLNSQDRERDFKNRLIEIFGRPYEDDLGPGGTYPASYDGPDLYHYTYVDAPALSGTEFNVDPITGQPTDPAQFGRLRSFTAHFNALPSGIGFLNFEGEDQSLGCGSNPFGEGCTLGDPPSTQLAVEYVTWDLPTLSSFSNIKPPTWTGVRPAAGKVQEALDEIMNTQVAMHRALADYEKLRQDVTCAADGIKAIFNLRNEALRIKNSERRELNQLTAAVQAMNTTAIVLRRVGSGIGETLSAASECVPDNFIVGVSSGGDLFSGLKCALQLSAAGVSLALDTAADGVEIAQSITESAKEDVSLQAAIELDVQGFREEMDGMVSEVNALLRQEPLLRNEVFARAQMVEQAKQGYRNALAQGLRTFQELVAFRKNTAAAVQDYRHQDMAFRIFRNDSLQKYRAAFDMAARFTYLAATAYDFDTNLLGGNPDSGRDFLTDIVRQRSLGQLLDGSPVPGSPGLADPLGRMDANFQVLKGQMGFNNPQIETNRFSLRHSLFRLDADDAADASWRSELLQYRVDNLWDVPEFRRLARPFTEESLGPQPGLVIPFSTTVTFGLNFFGWPLAGGDSAYDPSQFSTRVRSVGVWFDGYGQLPLSVTPRVYLVPAGSDILRPPTAGDFTTREWSVTDQLIPVPFDIGGDDLEDPDWTPLTDMLSGGFNEVRRFGSFRAYDYDPNGTFDSQTTADSRLIARSVWNTRWLLIIPGGTLLADPQQGIDTLIGTPTEPGVSDILIFFKTYAYSGF